MNLDGTITHRVRPPCPGADIEAWQRAERARNLLAVIHSLCSSLDVPEVDDEGEPLSAGERVWIVQEMTRESA